MSPFFSHISFFTVQSRFGQHPNTGRSFLVVVGQNSLELNVYKVDNEKARVTAYKNTVGMLQRNPDYRLDVGERLKDCRLSKRKPKARYIDL